MAPPFPSSGNRLADLLRDAGAAARAGDRSEAERLYRKILDRSPANGEAWMGLGTVVIDPAEKAACFQRVLQLDPENKEAAASLERLQAVLPASPEAGEMYCAFHPQVKTVLRCSQCGRPICTRCAHAYPVGQLCPICVRERRPLYYQPAPTHLLVAGGATLVAAALAGFLATWMARWGPILSIFGGPLIGSLLAQLALRAGQRHRGPAMQITVGLCTVVGSLLGGILLLSTGLLSFTLISFLLYVALAAGSAAAWLR